MFRRLFYVAFLFWPLLASGQQEKLLNQVVVDSLYREDQFYLGFTYNILTGMPEVAQSGFSGGFHVGFVRDFPINEQRNLALGAGLGWSINTYGHNLFIGEEPGNEETIFRILDSDVLDFDTNRFTTQLVEVPLQVRWRTSTPEDYNFWRIYGGLRLGYVYHFRSNFEQVGNSVRQTKVPEFDRFRLGATFSFGYSTFNFHFYYSLNPFFTEDAKIEGQPIDLRTLQVGLMFYLL